MTCAYCGIALDSGAGRCAGCGAYRTVPPAEPSGTASSIYEQIGRAVVERQPNETLDRLIHLGERKNASTREQKIARVGKILFCLFLLWQIPTIVFPLLGLAMMFFIWIYLPYRGVKAVWGWLSS